MEWSIYYYDHEGRMKIKRFRTWEGFDKALDRLNRDPRMLVYATG